MANDTFTLKEGEEFIELNKLLKFKSIAQTGGHAKIMVTEGEVSVNGAVETQVRKKLRSGDKVAVGDVLISVEH